MIRMNSAPARRGGMKRKYLLVGLLVGSVLVPGKVSFAQSELFALPFLMSALTGRGNPRTGIGVGAHYYKNLGQIEGTEFDDNYVSYLLGLKFKPNNAYMISSVYLDSDNLKLCRESLDGTKNRFKLRIRSYTDDLDYPRFFEIKRRVNTIIIKSRARVMSHSVNPLLTGSMVALPDHDTESENLR